MWEETSISIIFIHGCGLDLSAWIQSVLLLPHSPPQFPLHLFEPFFHIFFFPHLSHLYCSSIWPRECVRPGVICCWEYRWQELTWCSSIWRFGPLQQDYAVSNDRQWYSCFPCSICKPRCKPPWLHVFLLGPFLLCCKSFLEIFPALLCIFWGLHSTTELLGKKVSSKFNFSNPLFV